MNYAYSLVLGWTVPKLASILASFPVLIPQLSSIAVQIALLALQPTITVVSRLGTRLPNTVGR